MSAAVGPLRRPGLPFGKASLAVTVGLLLACRPGPSGERAVPDAGEPAELQSLRARVASKDVPGADALAGRLSGTPFEGQARILLLDLYAAVNDPRLGPEAARATQWLSQHGEFARAAQSARYEARPPWMEARYRDALAALERSRVLAERAQDPLLTGKALLGQFLLLYELGDLRNASPVLARAETATAAATVDIQALVALNQGLLRDAEGNRDSAQAAFQRAAALAGTQPSEVAWSARLNLLEYALRAGDRPRAERAQADVAAMYLSGGFRDRPLSRVAFGFYSAQLARLQGRPQQDLDTLIPLTREKSNENWKWKLALERGYALAALARHREAIAAFDEAMAVVEQMRGEQPDQLKSWVLAGRREPFIAAFELFARAGDAGRALEVLERTQGRTFLEAFAARTAAAAAGAPPFAQATRRADALKQLVPALQSSLLMQPAPLPWRALGSRLRGDDVVAYFEASNALHVVSVRGGHPRLHATATPLQQLRRLVDQFLDRPGEPALADALGAILFPEGALPAAGGTLYLAPTSLLGRLPFGALRVNGQYLADRHVLAQIPGLNALVALRDIPPEAAGPPIVLANAGGDLPAAVDEARSIAARLGPATRILLGAGAASGQLQGLGRVSLLHLALHSGVDAGGPWLGLSDRRVGSADILAWRPRADLVVLSSCASAATPDPGLWGSLTASFLATGSRAVVGALWSTRDEIGRQFMDDFYAAGGPRDPAGALARTQRAWIAAGRRPIDWAGYALFGIGPAEQGAHAPFPTRRPGRAAPFAKGD
jgi:hypothetical protein